MYHSIPCKAKTFFIYSHVAYINCHKTIPFKIPFNDADAWRGVGDPKARQLAKRPSERQWAEREGHGLLIGRVINILRVPCHYWGSVEPASSFLQPVLNALDMFPRYVESTNYKGTDIIHTTLVLDDSQLVHELFHSICFMSSPRKIRTTSMAKWFTYLPVTMEVLVLLPIKQINVSNMKKIKN